MRSWSYHGFRLELLDEDVSLRAAVYATQKGRLSCAEGQSLTAR